MKKYKSLIAVLIAIISIFCFSTNVFAATAEKYGLQATVTTNKASYTENEDIEIKVVVTNANNYAVSDIALEALLPDGLKLKDNNAPLTNQIDVLKAGETIKLELVAVYDSEYATGDTDNETSSNETPVGNNSSSTTKPAQTGDTIGILLIMLAIAVVAVIVMIIAIKHQKKAMKFFALILCVGISVPFLNTIVSNAAERSFTVTEPITVEDNTFEFQVKVYYGEKVIVEDTEIGLKIDQSDFTTTKIHEKLSGSFNSDKNVKAVTYINRYDYETNEETDFEQKKANIEGNTWSIPDILLRPGNNVISITAITTDNTKETKEINVNYDDGIPYIPDSKHAVMPDDGSMGYMDNIIMINFTSETSQGKVQEVVDSINGKIISIDNAINEYGVEVSPTDLDGLKKLCKQVEQFHCVQSAMYDIVSFGNTNMEVEHNYTRNNSYYTNNFFNNSNYFFNTTYQKNYFTDIEWNENNPDSDNWYLEAIQAPSAWNYNDRFSNIRIGVADDGFDTEHKNLDIQVINPEENRKHFHGNFVAGIIGAKPNYDKGVMGIVQNVKLLGYDIPPNEEQQNAVSMIAGIKELIKEGTKIVNLSQSIDNLSDEAIKDIGYWTSEQVLDIKRNIRSDFLVVQSAGNNEKDAINTGMFASITPEIAQQVLKDNYENTITVDDIMDSFIIVGAVAKASKDYELVSGFCYGSQISVVAPGQDIWSTVIANEGKDGYEKHSGTSASAPIVSGVAGLVWSVNENFSPGVVKDIVCNCTKDTVKPSNKNDTTPVYHMVNAKLAVEKAIELTDNKTGQVGGKVLDEQGNPLENVSVTFQSTTNSDISYQANTNKNGYFNINSILADNYKITYYKDGYHTVENSITIQQDLIYTIVDPVILTTITGVSGKIVNSDGDGVYNAKIEVFNSSNELVTTTTSNSAGNYICELENGTYKLVFTKEGCYTIVRENITVSNNIINVPDVVMDYTDLTATQIWTAEDFRAIKENPTGKYILMADLDLTESENVNYFNGTFLGNGHTITVPYDSDKGAFGEIQEQGIVKDVLVNVQSSDNAKLDTSGEDGYGKVTGFGALAYINKGIIDNITVTGNIVDNTLTEIRAEIGGIVAVNLGLINHCRNNANIEINGGTTYNNEHYVRLDLNSIYLGGIAGRNAGAIKNSLNTGNISVKISDGVSRAFFDIGGLAGTSTPIIDGSSEPQRGIIEECGNIGNINIRYKNNHTHYPNAFGFIRGTEYDIVPSDPPTPSGLPDENCKNCFIGENTKINFVYGETGNTASNIVSSADTEYTVKTNEEIETWWNETYSK